MIPTILIMTILLPNGGERHWKQHFKSAVACHFRAVELRRIYETQLPGTRVRYECRAGYKANLVPVTTG